MIRYMFSMCLCLVALVAGAQTIKNNTDLIFPAEHTAAANNTGEVQLSLLKDMWCSYARSPMKNTAKNDV